jgi:hypothetical protein
MNLQGIGDPKELTRSMAARGLIRFPTFEELEAAGLVTKGKAANFSLKGFYHCPSGIFRYGERDSFVDFLTKHAPKRARQVVFQLSQMERQKDPWLLRVESEEENLKQYTQDLFASELVTVLGAGKLWRKEPYERYRPLLRVVVRRLDDQRECLHVTALLPGSEEESSWRDL